MFEYSPLGKALEKQTEVYKTNKGKINKFFKAFIEPYEKYGDKLTNAWLSLTTEQVQKYTEIDIKKKTKIF